MDLAPLIREPLRVVDGLFAQAAAVAGGEVPSQWGEKEHFARVLGLHDEEAFANVPCLNDVPIVESVPPFTLVRYRGMVQDVFEPEIFASVFEEHSGTEGAPTRLRSSKYRESLDPAPGCDLRDLGRGGLAQRGACYLVPLPGESAWSKARSAATQCPYLPDLPATPPPVAKRAREEDVEMSQECSVCPRGRRPRANICTRAGGAQPQGRSANEFGLNLPLPWEQGQGSTKPCIVKLYDGDVEALKLQETVEVLGVLCLDPAFADVEALMDPEGLGRDARQPSSSLVPRVHVLHLRRLPWYHPMLPFSADWLSEARLAAAYQTQLGAPGALAAAREQAVQQLRRHLGGDALAAEYVLMLLVARSFGRSGDQALGSFPLNITSWPEGPSAKGLAEALSELLPRVVHLQLTAESLNTKRWRPSKDFVANRLVSGQLQLAPGSLLLLDETAMAEGQVSAQGTKSFAAVANLVSEGILPCDFMSYDVKIPLELLCLLVSKRRGIVKDVPLTLPLRSSEAVPAEATLVEPLDAARFLLALVTRRPKAMRISDEVGEAFSEDFAAARQELRLAPELCHTWMNLARARCLTFAEDELSLGRWREVFQLERERLRRCAQEGLLGGA